MLIFYNKTEASKKKKKKKKTCAGMFTFFEIDPMSDQVNDYTDIVLICMLF